MNSATFKIHHESLGLTTEFLAMRCGVSSLTSIWKYESTRRKLDVPDAAAQAMQELVTDFEEAADQLALLAEESGKVTRWLKAGDYWRNVPVLSGWPMASQPLLIAEVLRRVPSAVVEYSA